MFEPTEITQIARDFLGQRYGEDGAGYLHDAFEGLVLTRDSQNSWQLWNEIPHVRKAGSGRIWVGVEGSLHMHTGEALLDLDCLTWSALSALIVFVDHCQAIHGQSLHGQMLIVRLREAL